MKVHAGECSWAQMMSPSPRQPIDLIDCLGAEATASPPYHGENTTPCARATSGQVRTTMLTHELERLTRLTVLDLG